MIQLTDVCKSYYRGSRNEIEVLKNINLSLPDKGLIALCGKSGSGKTTLLNVIGGLIKIDKGEIFFNEKNVTNENVTERSRQIAYIFQNYCLNAEKTVFENVEDSLKISGMKDKAEIHKRVIDALKKVGLEQYSGRYPGSISGGQQQRVAVARAIVKEPNIILADEPTGNLDEKNKNLVMQLLRSVSSKCLVILVTHDLDIVKQYCDGYYNINEGVVSALISNVSQSEEIVTSTNNENKKNTANDNTLDTILKKKIGGLYNWKDSVASGYNAAFGKKSGHKALRYCLILLSIFLVLISAVFATGVRRLKNADTYNHHIFVGFVSDEEKAREIEQVFASGEHGIDNMIYAEGIYYENGIIRCRLADYENTLMNDSDKNSVYFYFTGNILPISMLTKRSDQDEVTISLGEKEALITTTLAKQLTDKGTMKYLSSPEDIVGIWIGNEQIYRVSGVIESDEPIMYINDDYYNSSRYELQFYHVNFKKAEKGIEDGSIVVVRNLPPEMSGSDPSDQVVINGIHLNIKNIVDVYYPYEKWLLDECAEVKKTEEEYCGDLGCTLFEYYDYFTNEYEKYLRYCSEHRENVYFDKCMEMALDGNEKMLFWLKAVLIANYDFYYAQAFYTDNLRYPDENELVECHYDYPDPYIELNEESEGVLSEREKGITYLLTDGDYDRCATSFGRTEGYGLETIRRPNAYVVFHTTDPVSADDYANKLFDTSDANGFSYFSPLKEIENERKKIMKEEVFSFVLWGAVVLVALYVIYFVTANNLEKRGKEFAISRCLGVSKKNIAYGFCIETTMIVTATAGSAALGASIVIWSLLNGQYAVFLENMMYYPLLMGIVIIVLLVVTGLLCSLLKIMFFLRKDPGDIIVSMEI